MNNVSMTPGERRIALSLAGVFSSRMLGLFMILPVFVLYAHELRGYSATLAGLAMGIYGLTQAMLQIPLGRLSDRIGRKPVIIGGLLVFALGSVIAAMSDSIAGVILGRALQGAGAIASAVLALAADLTREEHRIKVMAFIGISIGVSFSIALVLGPVLHGWFGVPGIFWATALLALGAIFIVKQWVPTPIASRFHRDTGLEPSWFRAALTDPQLLRVDIGILILHLIMMANFVVVPHILQSQLGLDGSQHWQVYLPVLLLSMAAILPFIILAEKKHKIKQILIGAVVILLVAQFGLNRFNTTLVGVAFMLWLFFVAFNLLEASLPSLVAKLAPVAHKGTAMGVYTTSQFSGVFLGGAVGGWLSENHGISGVFYFNMLLAAIWLLLVVSMRSPRYLSSQLLNVGDITEAKAQDLITQLTKIPGVEEAIVIAEDGIAYLKVDKKILDQNALRVFTVVQ